MTCIRPSHGIYSAKYKRWVTVEEMWKAQGLWVSNFENPQAVRDMLATNPKDAQDLGGNAFSGTAVQAKVLASMVHSMGWVNIANEKNQYKDGSIVVSALDDALHHATSTESNDVETGFQTPTDSKKCSLKRSFSMISTPRSATTSVSKDSGLKPVVDHQKPAEKGEKDPDPEPAPLKRQRYTKKSKPRECDQIATTSANSISQDGLTIASYKQHVEDLRSSGKKRSAIVKSTEEPNAKKRKYSTSGKTARNGKNGVISIFRKLQLLKVHGLIQRILFSRNIDSYTYTYI